MTKKRIVLCYAALAALVIVLACLNLLCGSVRIPVSQLPALLTDPSGGSTAGAILWRMRLPRLLAAALLGGALALAGLLLQSFFANPIAGPFVLGISSGAKLTVALAMILALSKGIVLGSASLIAAAFLGSMLSMGFILLVAGKVRKMSVLIICGVMIGYICSAITDFAVTFADDANIVNLHQWSLGSFSGADWKDIRAIAPVVLLGLAGSVALSKSMGAYALGENYAASMGVRIRRFRAELIALASFLAACVTAFAGPISFVGIAVPHLVKSLLKTSKPLLVIPASFLGGGAFCLFCDLLARTLFSPAEVSISSVTAVFGAPVVIWLMIRRQREGRDG